MRWPGYGRVDGDDHADRLDRMAIPHGSKARGREWDGVQAVEGIAGEDNVEAAVLDRVGEPPVVATARGVLAPLVAGAKGRTARELLPRAAELLEEKAPEIFGTVNTRIIESLLEEMLEEE
ncbi:MAG: hypothetical protein AB1816_16225 [Bacillota bacterium]